MKTSTIVVLGLAGAVGVYAVMKLRPATSTPSTTAAPAPVAKTSREAFERGAIDLGTRLGGKLIDSFFGSTDRSSSPITV